jgi:gliding motility-associated-like protein
VTPIGSTINFATGDTVSARFSYTLFLGCRVDSINFFQDGNNGINRWQWSFDSTGSSTSQDPVVRYSVFGNKEIHLVVTNGVCSDSSSVVIPLDNALKADFQMPSVLCPSDKAAFTDSSIGQIISWDWNFGDGRTSGMQSPPDQSYPFPGTADKEYTVSLVVENGMGCRDTALRMLKTLHTCYIAVPNAFTPNGDGINDYLYPLNAYKADNLEFRVFNRYGQLVFETRDWTRKWDGTLGGVPQSTGTYVWMLRYTERDTGKQVFQKGTTVLIR